MSLDERLRTDLAEAAAEVRTNQDALDETLILGRRRKLRRQAVLAGTMVAVVAMAGVATWRSLDTGSTDGSVVTADQATPAPTAEPIDEPDPIVQARIATAPIFNRVDPVGIWTGTEVVIWGGIEGEAPLTAEVGSGGAAYRPDTDEWRTIWIDEPGPDKASAVWTGSDILVWGGTGWCQGFDSAIVTCDPYAGPVVASFPAAYLPPAGASRAIALRVDAEVLWTGDRMIVWGGSRPALRGVGLPDGAIYNAATDAWEMIPDNPFGQGGRAIIAFHENSLIIGAGAGWSGSQIPSPAGWSKYSMDTAEWRGLPRPPVDLEVFAAGVQVGENVVVFNGNPNDPTVKGTGAILDLSTDTWVELAGPPDRPDGVDGVAIGNRAVFLAPETGRLLIYDLDVENWTTWQTGDDTLVGARTLVQAGDTQVMAWNGTTGEGVIVDIAALPILSSGSAEIEPDQVTEADRELVLGLISFGQDRVSNGVLDQFSSEGVGFTLGDRDFYFTATADELADSNAWTIFEPEGFAEFAGPFSALDLLAELNVDRSGWELTVDEYNRCAGPPRPRPPGTEGLRQLNVQPTNTDSCIQWFAVDLYTDTQGTVRAVRLDLFGP